MKHPPKADKWSGVTAPSGSALRSAQLVVDHHVSHGKLLYTSDGLAEAIEKAIMNNNFEDMWRRAIKERDDERRSLGLAGVHTNALLGEVASLKATLKELVQATAAYERLSTSSVGDKVFEARERLFAADMAARGAVGL